MGHALGNNYGKFYGFQSKPVILDLQFTVDSTTGTGTSNVKGQGVSAVYMHAGTPSAANPNPDSGYALIHLAYNYTKLYGGPWNILPPLTGSNLAINASALSAGTPYQITAVGHSEAGTVTIAPVADVAGSLASKYFLLYDGYGQTFAIWFSVDGVGTAPVLDSSVILVQQSIAADDTAGTIGTALATTIAALPSTVSGVYSFTASGTTTVTVVSTQTNPYGPLPGAPQDGAGSAATGFTFAKTKYNTNNTVWQAVGLPKGVIPAVGASFIATAAGYATGGGSTGTVKAFGSSGIIGMEILGNANLSLGPVPMGGSANAGGWVLVKFLASSFTGTALGTHTHSIPPGTDGSGGTSGATSAGTPAGTISYAAAAPAAGTQIYMQLLLEQAAQVGGNNE